MHRLKKIVRKSVVQEIGKVAYSGLVEALKQADGITSIAAVPGLKLALQSLLALIQAVDQSAQNSDDAKRLQDQIESLTTSILIPIEQEDLKDMPHKIGIELDRLAKTLETHVTNCRVKISHGWFHRFIHREDDQKDVANMCRAIDRAIAQFLSVAMIEFGKNIVQVRRKLDQSEEQNQIRKLASKNAENANHLYESAESAQRSKCLEGTRVTILENIRSFLEDVTDVNLFWLSGIAGSGKSTIAQSAAVEATLWADCIVASFFFSRRGLAELRNASFVFPTLACQLSLSDGGFRKRLSGIIEEQPNILEEDPVSQYKSLIVEPLKAMNRTQRRIFIVLDAFDECEPRGATAILNALLKKDNDVPKELKVLATSRPEARLRMLFDAQPDDSIRKLDLRSFDAGRDIQNFLVANFKQAPTSLATPLYAGEDVISKLAESAGGSFIYAASILRFVFDEHAQDPQGRLDILLGNRTDPEERPYERLDALYLSILHQAVPSGTSSPIKRRLRSVLGQLVTFREPLPMAVMEKFCGLKFGGVKSALHNLHSLIQVPDFDDEAPHVYHLSFSDFIVDPTRCTDGGLVVDVDSIERGVLLSCFDHLSLQLHRNMADIDDPSLPQSEIDGFQIRVENSVSPELRYACLYWASHLIKIKDTDNEKVWPHLQKFLTRCLLWWIETMALLDTLREAAESVNRVRTWMASKVGDRFRLLASLMNDASRFLSYHADTISFNPLHVYHSALPFTPTETQLRKVYAHELKTSVKAPHGVEQGWDPTVMVKRCEVPICGVSLSPNGQFITAIGSKTIEIRDTLIGSSVVSIDLPKPLFYISVSSCIDGVDVGYRLKELVQVPAMPIEGPEVESRVVEALKHAEDIADLTPVSGLKNVLRSLLALIHAGYNYEQDRFMHLRKLQRRVEVFTKVVLMQIKGKELSDIPRRVLSDMEEFTREIEALTTTCRHMLSQGRLDRFAAGVENMRLHLIWEVSIWYRCISDAIEQFMKRDAIQQLESVVDVKRGIEAIYPENGKNSFNVSTNLRRAECLDGTRTVVLGKIFAWLKDPSGARTFWLSGIAGSGKSAIAQSASIRAALLPDHIVVSIFFSQFGYARLCDPSSVFQTLAFQLSLLDIGYKERLSEVFNEHPDILEKDLQCQYEKLIIEALGAIRRSHKYIIITLDGLDECEPYGVTAVLKVLLAEDIDHPRELKILTSSRPEAHLRSIFDAHTDIRKLSLEDVETESDILHYLRTSFKQHQTHLIDSLTVSEETISELAKRAGDSFIYATTIVRFIFDEPSRDPQMRADFLLRNTADPERRPHARLDDLFLNILRHALPLQVGGCNDEKRRLRTVLGLLVCLREPMPILDMEAFCGLNSGDIMWALHHLHSLVQVPTSRGGWAPHIYHRSFTDFIVDPARCQDRNLVVDISSTEKRIFNKCSSLCNLWQRKVVNDLLESDSRANNRVITRSITKVFSTREQYACLFWASHLINIKDADRMTQDHLDDRCLLRWIESMALLGMRRDAMAHIDQVRTWITSLKGQGDKASDRLVDLMENAFRLLLHHATVMSFESTLIYGSALFTSAATFQPLVVEVNCNGGYRLCESSHELSAHSELVSAQMPKFKACLDFKPVVAWSPNSQYVAVSLVHGFEIRDALSGSIVDSFFLSPSSECVMDLQQVSCRCLAFFMDDSRVAWITRGGSIQVWNTLTKKVEFAVTVGEGLVSINVSPNGKLLVSGSKSGRIQVRNAKDGTLVWEVDTNTKLKSTSISPNSRFIVTLSFSCDGVRIWDADDEFLRTTLPHDVISASFSPDSDELATIDQEGVIRVWGMSRMSTDPIQEWRIDPQPVCLVFSPNGLQLAAAASENVHILHRDTDYVAMLNGHTGPVTSLAFSADGLTLTSGSLDMTIRVWDASSVKSSIFGLEKDKQEKWSRVCWSPRCHTVMAYGSLERKAQIWSTQDGAYRVLEGCWNDGGFPVAISDCGRYIAQRSKFGPWWQRKEMITTRRNTSDATQSNVAGHSDAHRIASGPYQYKFFPNSTRFAVVSGTKILTWDASVTCPEVTRLVGHSGEVLELHFVPDCSRLVSRARARFWSDWSGGWIDSKSDEIFVWNVDNLQLLSTVGQVIPRFHPHEIEATDDDWVTMILPDDGGRRRLFRLPSGCQPRGIWSTSESCLSKCILIRLGNENVLIVDFSALPAAVIADCTS